MISWDAHDDHLGTHVRTHEHDVADDHLLGMHDVGGDHVEILHLHAQLPGTNSREGYHVHMQM